MGKTTQKIKAKRFLEDYRAGTSDAELMKKYALSRASLDKLLEKLVAQDLLDPSEVRSGLTFPATIALEMPPFGEPLKDEESVSLTFTEPAEARTSGRQTESKDDSSVCTQCGAKVSGAMLICPECGHVLPGEERWAQVEPAQGFLDRVPPKLLGSILALPVAVVLFFVFKDIILPMTDATIEKRVETMRRSKAQVEKALSGSDGIAAQVEQADPIDRVVEELIDVQILSGANEDLTVFYTGSHWPNVSEDERIQHLERIRSVMGASYDTFEFEVVDPQGRVVAWVNERLVSPVAQGRTERSDEDAK